MSGLKVVVWDVDDTLYLERSYARSGFQAVSDYLESTEGIEGFSQMAWSSFERGVRGTIFNTVLEALGLEPTRELIQNLVRVYRHHVPQIELLPDARAIIEDCRASGLKMAVITDGPLPSQRAKVLALDLEEFAEPVICTSALGPGLSKPHPKAFEMVADYHAASQAELVYVADNPLKDFKAPHALGWRTVRLRRHGGLHRDLPTEAPVDLECETLDGVMEFFLEGV